MGETNVVLEAALLDGGALHLVPFYVENGMIHTNIEGRVVIVPTSDAPPESTVKGLMRQHLEHKRVKRYLAAMWS